MDLVSFYVCSSAILLHTILLKIEHAVLAGDNGGVCSKYRFGGVAQSPVLLCVTISDWRHGRFGVVELSNNILGVQKGCVRG